MHAAYPWNVTLLGLTSPRGSLLVLRLNTSFTPHAWTPRDLGFLMEEAQAPLQLRAHLMEIKIKTKWRPIFKDKKR